MGESSTWSLPQMSGEFEKHGFVVKLSSKIFLQLKFGVLFAYRSCDTAKHQQESALVERIVLSHNEVTVEPLENEVRISIIIGYKTFTFLCTDKNEQAAWLTALKASSEWKFADFYSIDKTLAKGGGGEVYQAKSKKTGATVAIKSISKNETTSDMEANLMSEITHPHVLSALDVLETPKFIFIVMPLMRAGSLRDIMHKRPLPEIEARILFRQLVYGLSYLHKSGIVHRDIKPENLFVEGGPRLHLRIGDFGLAARLPPGGDIKNSAVTLGTPMFVAPEMLKMMPYGAKVDVWACGVILYEMLTGNKPFDGPDYIQMFNSIKMGQFDIKELSNKGCSRQAKTLIQLMLQTNTKHRIDVEAILEHEWLDG